MNFRRRRWIFRWFVPAFAAATFVGPAAARPMVDDPGGRLVTSPGEFAKPAPSTSPRVVPSPQGGFDWRDAGVGAVGTLSLLLLTGGSVLVVRESRRAGLAEA